MAITDESLIYSDNLTPNSVAMADFDQSASKLTMKTLKTVKEFWIFGLKDYLTL